MKREILFKPAYDKTHSDPNKNFGIHGVDLIFYLKSSKAVVQFVVSTNWHLPHVRISYMNEPMGVDVGYHSPTPQYKGQSSMECSLLPEGKCYYDGSSLMATEMLELLIAEGDEAVWKRLEEIYKKRFGNEEE